MRKWRGVGQLCVTLLWCSCWLPLLSSHLCPQCGLDFLVLRFTSARRLELFSSMGKKTCVLKKTVPLLSDVQLQRLRQEAQDLRLKLRQKRLERIYAARKRSRVLARLRRVSDEDLFNILRDRAAQEKKNGNGKGDGAAEQQAEAGLEAVVDLVDLHAES